MVRPPTPVVVAPPATPSPVQADKAVRTLSLAQAIEFARINAENIAVSRTRLESARARFQAVGAMPAPEFRLGHDDGRSGGESAQEFAFRFRFNNPWETQALREEGLAQTQSARFQVQLAERLLVTEATKLYFDAVYRREDASHAGKIANAQSTIRSTYDTLFAAGQITLPKALQARLDASEKASESAEAEHAAEHAAMILRAYLDLPESQPLNLVTPFSPTIPGTTTLIAEDLFLTASLGRPGLLALESESAAARARVRQAEARRMPWFSFVQASLEHERRTYADSNQWGILLGIDFPFWERQADLQIAASELNEALALQRLARRDLRLAVTVAFREYKSALQRLADREASVTNLERELAPSLAESADGQGIDLVSRHRLRLGLLQAHRDLLKVRYQCQSARVALETILGHPLEQALPNEK